MPDEPTRERPIEWEGGDPPCWAHLFEDDEALAPPLPQPGASSLSQDHPAEPEAPPR
jgi:hypothetical protein